MESGIAGHARAGAQEGGFRGSKALVVAALAALLSGCFAGYPGPADFQDPAKSVVFVYIRADEQSYGPTWVHLRQPGGGGEVALSWIYNGSTKVGECDLYVAAIDSGVYEFQSLSGDRFVYRFPDTSQGNYALRVGKPDTYVLGQFQLHTIKKSEEMDRDAFTLKPTTGCPGDKAAYRTLLGNVNWKPWLEGTRWEAVLARKSK